MAATLCSRLACMCARCLTMCSCDVGLILHVGSMGSARINDHRVVQSLAREVLEQVVLFNTPDKHISMQKHEDVPYAAMQCSLDRCAHAGRGSSFHRFHRRSPLHP